MKLLAVTARVKWTVVGQPLQFIEYITRRPSAGMHINGSSVFNKLKVNSHVAQW